MLKILQADDHPLFREGIDYLLKKLDAETITLQAGSIQKALEITAIHDDIDLILLDLTMPGMENFEGYYAIEESNPAIPIVILSASEDPKNIRMALEAGAAGYIPKSATSETMVNALKIVLSGGIYEPPDISYHGEDFEPNANNTLTDRQQEVLVLLSEGLSNKLIARKLDLSENTVKHHVSSILRILGVGSRTQAVLKIREMKEV